MDLDYCDIEWFALKINRYLSFLFEIFEIEAKYCFKLFVDYEVYSISSKVFLPTVVDKMIIWIKCIHFISLIPKMLMFTLAIFCLTTSSFPWLTDLTFQVTQKYCSLQHRTLLPSPATAPLGVVFTLTLFLHSFWSYFPLFSSSILGTYRAGEFIFQGHIFLPFILLMGFSRQ